MIYGIKLVTGEELISNAARLGDGRLQLTDPMQLRMVPPQIAGAGPSMGFVPFPAFGSEKPGTQILIEPLHTVYVYTPDEQIRQEYERAISGNGNSSTQQIITG